MKPEVSAFIGRYSCPLCPTRFHDLADKKQHMRDEHPKPVKK